MPGAESRSRKLANREICEVLEISAGTVDTHVAA
jgi:DNA-binding CsgD family transcriptional regulator